MHIATWKPLHRHESWKRGICIGMSHAMRHVFECHECWAWSHKAFHSRIPCRSRQLWLNACVEIGKGQASLPNDAYGKHEISSGRSQELVECGGLVLKIVYRLLNWDHRSVLPERRQVHILSCVESKVPRSGSGVCTTQIHESSEFRKSGWIKLAGLRGVRWVSRI